MTEAIAPGEARKTASKTEFAHHIKRINSMLKDGRRTYATDLIGDNSVQDEVIDAFRKKGWRVKEISDPRDGNYLEFQGP